MKNILIAFSLASLVLTGCKKNEEKIPESVKPEYSGYFLVTTNVHYWDYVSGDSYRTIHNDTIKVEVCSDISVIMPHFTNICLLYNCDSSNTTQTVFTYNNIAALRYYNNYPDSISGYTEYGTYHVTESRIFAGHRIK